MYRFLSIFKASPSLNRLRLLALLVSGSMLFGAASNGWAHGDLHDQIVAVTLELEKQPRNAELYLRRAELHRAHSDWEAAQVDYYRVAELGPEIRIVDLARGKMFLDANWPVSARVALDRFLSVYTNHVEGLTARGRALAKLGRRMEAVRDFTRAITNAAEPLPELFIERAQALAGEGESHFGEAIAGLDEGVKKLGSLVTLQLFAIDLEVQQQQFDSALRRLEGLAERSPRKETYLYRRGEILRKAGREAEAREAFESGLKALDRLPPSRRRVPATVALEQKLQQALASGSTP